MRKLNSFMCNVARLTVLVLLAPLTALCFAVTFVGVKFAEILEGGETNA